MIKVIGVTGGVGSGKSRVLQYLQEEYGAVVCQLDQVAKELQKSGQPCFEKIVEQFGTEVVGTDGELNREKLADMVFSDKEKLKQLNRIVHPEVKRETVRRIAAIEEQAEADGENPAEISGGNPAGASGKPSAGKSGGVSLFIIEAALLPTAGYEDICDEMWYIYTEEQIRRSRLRASRGYSEEKITHMIKSQPGEERFRKTCTAVIDNSGTFEHTKRQIGELL